MDMALSLGRLTAEDELALSGVFNDLGLSHVNQKELLTNVEEIAVRDGVSPAELLTTGEIGAVLSDGNLHRQQKTRRLRDCLRKRRFPRLHAAEREFGERVKQLQLGPRISLKPSDYFEGTDLFLNISFKDFKELRTHLTFLSRRLNEVEAGLRPSNDSG